MAWNVSGEFLAYEKDSWSFYPTARYNRQARKANINIGSLARYRIDRNSTFSAGIWYKNTHTAIISFDLAYQNYFFAATYDFAFANRNVLGQTNSAFEISLIWRKPIEKKSSRRPPKKYPRKNNTNKPILAKDTSNKSAENTTRIDTLQVQKTELGESNRVEEKGSMKVIIREPLEVVAPKKKIALTHTEKLLLKPIFADQEDKLELSTEQAYQLAQMLFRREEIKLKIVLYYSQAEDLAYFSNQAEEFRNKLILQGIEPKRIKRQNIFRPKEKTRVEWVILR